MRSDRALAIVVGASLATGCAVGAIAARYFWRRKYKSSTIKQIMLCKFKDNISFDEMKRLVDEYGELVTKMPNVKDYEWGENVSDQAIGQLYTHVFECRFDDGAGVKAYLDNPAHVDFVKKFMPKLDSATVVEYNPKSASYFS